MYVCMYVRVPVCVCCVCVCACVCVCVCVCAVRPAGRRTFRQPPCLSHSAQKISLVFGFLRVASLPGFLSRCVRVCEHLFCGFGVVPKRSALISKPAPAKQNNNKLNSHNKGTATVALNSGWVELQTNSIIETSKQHSKNGWDMWHPAQRKQTKPKLHTSKG